MKTHLIFLTLVTFALTGYCQTFNLKFSRELTDMVMYNAVEWMDADNDSLLDVLAFAKNSIGEEMIFLFKHDTVNGPQFSGHINSGIKMAAYFITDYDGDNRLDVLVSGQYNNQPLTRAFLNRGSFLFEAVTVLSASGSLISLADLDQDGFEEIILSGNNGGQAFLKIFRRTLSSWILVNDSISIEAHAIEVFDFDSDGDMDFVVSAIDEQEIPVTRAFYNQKNFYFTTEDIEPSVVGATSRGDLNHDGDFDILISGKGGNNNRLTLAIMNTDSGFGVNDTLDVSTDAGILAADFNSDGICDINFWGLEDTGDTLNMILRQNFYEILSHRNLLTQKFGDYDRDGDLDLLQLLKTNGDFNIAVHQNSNALRNFSPKKPANPVSAMIYNRFFLYWEKPADDHTPVASLTYDVCIKSTGQDLISGQFDIFNGRRLSVSHGNNGTSNYVLLRTYQPTNIDYYIQSVDNAFHAGADGICKGSGGGSCIEMETINLEACKNEHLRLGTESDAQWFSFANGFLGEASALDFIVQLADTIFSVQPQISGCHIIKVYTINTPGDLTRTSESTDYVCEGEILQFGAESGWTQLEWSSSARGFLSNADSIEFVVSQPDTIKLKVSDGSGCHIQRNTILKISKPAIDVMHDAYQIIKGESVEMSVSGGDFYAWVPASTLNHPLSSNPTASPLKTTEYTVTVKDSIGCSAVGRVLVMVEETAFVPNLFTPNHDGNNDVLKIFGLGQVTDFSFTIFNREGNQVFHTKSITEAVNGGWNGTARGVEQPAGVYYWSVKGETGSGRNLQLNGKNSGSIVLVR